MNNNTKEEMIQWYRNCPSCGKPITYSSLISCEASYNILPLCSECRSIRLPGGQPKPPRKRSIRTKPEVIDDSTEGFLAKRLNGNYIRKCPNPECRKNIEHRGHQAEANARTAIRTKKLCHACRNTENNKNNPNFTFRGKTWSEEAKEKASISMCQAWDRRKQEVVELNNNIKELQQMNNIPCQCYPISKSKE